MSPFDMGYAAFYSSKVNPFDVGTDAHAEWERGYSLASYHEACQLAEM